MVTNRQQESLYTVTNRQVIAFLAAIVILAGNHVYNSFFLANDKELKSLRKELREIKSTITEIRRDDLECRKFNEEQEARLDELERYRVEHTRWGYESLQKDEKRMSKMETQIEQCLDHIRNERPMWYPRGSGVLDSPNGARRQHRIASE